MVNSKRVTTKFLVHCLNTYRIGPLFDSTRRNLARIITRGHNQALRSCCVWVHRHGRQVLPAMKRGMPSTWARLLVAGYLTRGCFARKTSISSSSQPPFLRSHKTGEAFPTASSSAPFKVEDTADASLLLDKSARRSRRTSTATCRSSRVRTIP